MENLQNTYHWISFHDLNRIRKRLDFIGTNCFSCAIIFHIFASSFVQTYPRQLKSQGSDPKRFLLHFPHWKIYNNATLDKSGTQPRRIRHWTNHAPFWRLFFSERNQDYLCRQHLRRNVNHVVPITTMVESNRSSQSSASNNNQVFPE